MENAMGAQTKINPTLACLDEELQISNYKDATVFDVDADIRPSLLYEREQFKPLARNFMQFLSLNVRQHALVVGYRGSGKTSLVKYILKEIGNMHKFDFDVIYVNCRDRDNSYKIMKSIIGLNKRVPKDHVITYFVEHMQKINKKVFIILDEVDLMADDDILYNVTRKQELNNVLLVLITKTPKFYESLSGDVKSSLKKDMFYFDTYDYFHIKEILTKRAEAGLNTYDQAVLFQIAVANVNQASSDVRVGIRVLEAIFSKTDHIVSIPEAEGKEPKVSKVVKDKIDGLMDKEYKKMKEGVLRNLGDAKLLVLYYCLMNGRSNTAYKQFEIGAHTQMSKTNFLKYVDELAYMDLMFVQTIREGRSTVLQFTENIGKDNIALCKETLEQKNLL
jgi:Cdc6-like AAA superfamily ATPase